MPVEACPFGPDTTPVSLLGFGCGAVGGLMVRGAATEQERAVARALEAGINYFETAVQYGDGTSEQHLGRILRRLGAKEALVGTCQVLEEVVPAFRALGASGWGCRMGRAATLWLTERGIQVVDTEAWKCASLPRV